MSSPIPTNLLIIPVITTAIFCISKFAEMKFIDKDTKPLKVLFRDALVVFISALTATYILFYFNDSILEFMNVITDTKSTTFGNIIGGLGNGRINAAEIFTDSPAF
jgi:hypothetical protein